MYKEILCNFNNLREAYQLTHRSKTDNSSTILFDKDKLYNIKLIQKQLESKEWNKLFTYYRFTIYEPKERIIDAMDFRGRIVQHVLCDKILKPYFEKRLIKENCACREDKGTTYALDLVKQNLIKYYKTHSDGYVLKIDVHKFFPNIKHTVLKQLLNNFPDKEIKELLFYIIDNSPELEGIPIGNQTSQWFALYYLDKIDRIIKEQYKIKFYTRYMDDLIIIHEDKHLLQELLITLTDSAKERGLLFNNKTQIIPLKRGFTFLGWRFCYKNNKVILRISNEKRNARIDTINKLNHLPYYMQEEYRISIINYLNYGDTYTFMKNHNLIMKRL